MYPGLFPSHEEKRLYGVRERYNQYALYNALEQDGGEMSEISEGQNKDKNYTSNHEISVGNNTTIEIKEVQQRLNTSSLPKRTFEQTEIVKSPPIPIEEYD